MGERGWFRPLRKVMAAMLAAAVACGCTARTPAGTGQGLRGSRLEVVAVWSGVEEQHFQLVLRAFERQTGVTVSYLSAGYGVPAFLQTRLARGQPPDVAFLPQPALLRSDAAKHLLVPLDPAVARVVAQNYDPAWQQLGSVGGRLYGVWFKAASKSLIWYNEGIFERAGVAPPADLAGLELLADKVSAAGTPAFSVGGADGWTLADWFSNFYLGLAGPARYDLLTGHRIPWTDPTVKAALRLMAAVLAPSLVAGGPRGALHVTYEESVIQTFAASPAAAMVYEGDFVAAEITDKTRARLGVDADVFPFPAVGQYGPMVIAGGDAAVLMRQSPAGEALISYLASPQAAAIWAAQGGFVSPNASLDLSVYPDEISRSIARGVIEADGNLRFSLSDLAPSAFGGTERQGIRGILQDFLVSRDVDATAARLEAAAKAAYGP